MIDIVVVGSLETNCYLYSNLKKQTIIIDPGAEPEKIERTITSKGLIPIAIINTHAHADHIGANSELKKKYSIPIYAHSLEFPSLVSPEKNLSFFEGLKIISPAGDVALTDGQVLNFPDMLLKVWHTPGHTPGSVCLLGDNFIFTGDTIFNGSIGRCDLPGGDEEAMRKTISRFLKFDGNYILYPGHGPQTTLESEKRINPFFTTKW